MSSAAVPETGRPLVRSDFGRLPDGSRASRWTLTAGGLECSVLTWGAAVQELWAPGRDGERANVVLGLPTLADYVERNRPFLGAIVGRYANRIANAEFELDGIRHRLDANDGAHCLHGGSHGFAGRLWHVAATRASRDSAALTLRCASPDGDGGFPGALVLEATYTLRGGALRLDFRAATDRPTVLNPASHVYWQLAGEGAGTVDDHELTVAASRFLPAGRDGFPAREPADVAGTACDLRTPVRLAERVRDPRLAGANGLDHHFLLDRAPVAARLSHPPSGRRLEILTSEPGLQVYTGNHLDGSLAGTGGRLYRQGDGIALETQHAPDSPNRPEFPSTVLRPGRVFSSTTVFRLSCEEPTP